ncbi:DC1 - like 10 [Theobroma cacao]|nr:DC1 - like 10 [Theobroma cacao]
MEYKHFGHQHNLRIYQLQPGDHEYRCSGCDSFCSGSAYGCLGCKFFLHEQCGNAGRSLQHPSHPFHHLTLVPYTTHLAGTFACNACGDTGNAFSYCCPLCDVDLHVPCAFLPQIIKHESHLHSLSLTYSLPFPNVSSRFCDICHKLLDCKYWSYNCFACNFAAHALCAAKEMRRETCHGEHVSSSGTTAPQSNEIHLKEDAASGTTQDQPELAEIQDPTLQAMCELERLKLQMQMTNELAKMMASFNLSSLI